MAMASERTVSIYLQRATDPEPVLLMSHFPRSKLEAHSQNLRYFLSGYKVENEHHREITLPTGSPGGLRHVLAAIKLHRGDEDLYIGVSRMEMAKIIAVWEAADVLDLVPTSAMGKFISHISWYVSHNKITPDLMEKVHAVFAPSIAPGDTNRRRPWDGLVHQYVSPHCHRHSNPRFVIIHPFECTLLTTSHRYAWDLIHDRYSPSELQTMISVYKKYPELAAKIELVTSIVSTKRDALLAQRASNGRRRARGGKKAGKKPDRADENYQQNMLRQAEQVLNGERAWRAELEPYLQELKNKPESGDAEPTEAL